MYRNMLKARLLTSKASLRKTMRCKWYVAHVALVRIMHNTVVTQSCQALISRLRFRASCYHILVADDNTLPTDDLIKSSSLCGRLVYLKQRVAMVQPVLGDLYSDLPSRTSFNMAERVHYGSEAQTPFQHFLRREPPFHESCRQARAQLADKAMQASHELQRKKINQLRHTCGGVEKASMPDPCVGYQRISVWPLQCNVCGNESCNQACLMHLLHWLYHRLCLLIHQLSCVQFGTLHFANMRSN